MFWYNSTNFLHNSLKMLIKFAKNVRLFIVYVLNIEAREKMDDKYNLKSHTTNHQKLIQNHFLSKRAGPLAEWSNA